MSTIRSIPVFLGFAILGCELGPAPIGSFEDESEDDGGEMGSEESTGDGDASEDATETTDETGEGVECPPAGPPPLVGGGYGTSAGPDGLSVETVCLRVTGTGPDWQEGLLQAADGFFGPVDGGSVDFVGIDSDEHVYAAGWVREQVVMAWFSDVSSWTSVFTHSEENHPVYGVAATEDGGLWAITAPEHVQRLDQPLVGNGGFGIETRYFDRIASGDDDLLLVTTFLRQDDAEQCEPALRVGFVWNSLLFESEPIATTATIGLTSDGTGGAWVAYLVPQAAGVIVANYVGANETEPIEASSFVATHADGTILDGDLAWTEGELVLAMRAKDSVEIHRFDTSGQILAVTTLPDAESRPTIALEPDGTVVVGFDTGTGFTLAGVSSTGQIDWSGQWECEVESELRDLAVSSEGIWLGGRRLGIEPGGWIGRVGF